MQPIHKIIGLAAVMRIMCVHESPLIDCELIVHGVSEINRRAFVLLH